MPLEIQRVALNTEGRNRMAMRRRHCDCVPKAQKRGWAWPTQAVWMCIARRMASSWSTTTIADPGRPLSLGADHHQPAEERLLRKIKPRRMSKNPLAFPSAASFPLCPTNPPAGCLRALRSLRRWLSVACLWITRLDRIVRCR